MILSFFSILVFFCVWLFVYLTTRSVVKLEQKEAEAVLRTERNYQDLLGKKEASLNERLDLEKEANRIFALYELNQEITKKQNENDAFFAFKTRLRENATVEECLVVEELDPNETPSADTLTFSLNDEKTTNGYLVCRGVAAQDRDRVSILSHQFSLALRRVRLYREIEKIAINDSLTGVHTRRYFLERFEEEIRRSAIRKINLSFLMIDVDFFKHFNDEYGHITGDQILKEVGAIIKATIREIDIAGRYGGEEFCVVLPDTDCDGALFVAERIRSAVAQTQIKAYDASVRATVSIGVATFPTHGRLSHELMDKADWALYRAKKSGRNRTCSFGVYKEQ